MVNNVENKCDCKCIHIDRMNIAKNVLEDCIDIESLAEFYKNFADFLKKIAVLRSVAVISSHFPK